MYITVKEYAEQKGVTARAVHKQINNHAHELEEHVIFREGKKWLDEEAVNILDKASKNSPVVYVEDAKMAHLKDLEEQVKELTSINELLKEKVISLQEDKIAYIALQKDQELLLEKHENLKNTIDNLNNTLNDKTSELDMVKSKLEQSEQQVDYLKNRSLLKRIFNK